eukprot:GILJ01008587.1.p1 GENE.GILJ01008587.1~~GILJ01008587.1.p1  ORF type:complete len:567 (+),score=80.61 GILJ01008587.1:30-1703(+)
MELSMENLLDSLQQCLNEVARLNALQDPPSTPFKSKYSARQLLVEFKNRLLPLLSADEQEAETAIWETQGFDMFSKPSNSSISSQRALLAFAKIHHAVGTNYIDTEEHSLGERHLSRAVEIFKSCGTVENVQCLCELQDCYNQLGLVWSNRDQSEKGLQYLTEAASLYTDRCGKSESLPLRSEQLYTVTCFYLAQAYSNLQCSEQSAYYCAVTLKRQVENDTVDRKEWAVNCAGLAQLHLSSKSFAQALYLFSAALALLPSSCEEQMATIHRQLGQYYLSVLKTSVEVQSGLAGSSVCTLAIERVVFPSLSIDWVDVTFATTFEQARELFKKGNSWFQKAAKYFILEGFVTEHISILQDQSTLYKYLVYFESDEGRLLAMHKRRVELLSPLLKELSPFAYVATFRDIAFEVAEINHELLDIKLADRLKRAAQPLTSKDVQRINQYGLSGLEALELFLRTFEKGGKPPLEVDDELLQWYLTARFNRARIYSKLLDPEPEGRIKFLRNTMDEYRFIRDYADSHLAQITRTQVMPEELKICREMVDLIPVKMNHILRGTL